SDFKNDILTLSTDQEDTVLLLRYEDLSPSSSRQKMVAGWLKQNSAEQDNNNADSAALAPPAPDTAVTAKRTKKPEPETAKVAAATVTVAESAAPTPIMEMSKPTLKGGSPTIQEPTTVKVTAKPEARVSAKPAAKAEPKAEPKVKSEAITQAKAKEPSSEEIEQTKLLKAYSSNVLKLTYLNTQYPKRSMDFKQEGIVVLEVSINRRGSLLETRKVTESKHDLLNKAAIKAVKKSAPFPEPPNTLKGNIIKVKLPFNFKL
ncbi:MAG: protein TonB, partial [Oceanicoccus sp.]